MFRLLSVLSVVPCLLLGVVSAAPEVKPAAPLPSDPAAEKLMQDAHRARSGWDASFPGFTCKLVAVIDGKTATGKLAVSAAGKVKVELPDGAIKEWATRQLGSLVSHRLAETRDRYDVTFADTETRHPLGRLLQFSGVHNQYRINGDVITEVHRQMGEGKFTITVTDVVRNPEGKYLPRSFNVSYWDGAGNLVRNEDYLEEYTHVGKFDVPARRLQIKTAKGERVVGELRMSDHELSVAKQR